MTAGPVITLTTDFGYADAYVAAMKGVILSINPAATIVDLSHDVGPQDVRQGAFLLKTTVPYFPEGSIHVAVVDPGVGTERRALLVAAPKAYFLAPDNGLLSFVLDGDDYRAYQLTEPSYWRHPVSSTFQGRDIFAPVAAHLSLGVSPEGMGRPIDDIYTFPFPHPRTLPDGSMEGEVLHIDRFGNLITSIGAGEVPRCPLQVMVGGERIGGLGRSYAEGEGLLALMGSSGYLEIALRDGSAARAVGAGVGTKVRVSEGI